MSEYRMIDISGVDERKFVKEVYRLSSPQGLGFLHARDGELDEETVDEILSRGSESSYCRIRMDYVHGRSCKMTVNNRDGKMVIPDRWYDHSDRQLDELLQSVGIDRAARTVVFHYDD